MWAAKQRENENLDAVTVAYSEPRYYRSGTINFEHNFPEAGYFVGIVTAIGDHGEQWVSRFPFSVGKSFMRALPAYLLLGIGVISAFFIYLYHRKLTPPAPVKPIAPHDPEPPHEPGADAGGVGHFEPRASLSADLESERALFRRYWPPLGRR